MNRRPTTGDPNKFGWCIGHPSEQQHEQCIVLSVNGNRCSCDCHNYPQKEKA